MVRKYLRFLTKSLCKVVFLLADALKAVFRVSNKTLTVYYCMDYCPASFDICTFCTRAEIECRRRGLKTIHMVLFFDLQRREREYGIMQDAAGQKWRFDHVVLPVLQLYPIISSFAVYTSKWKAIRATGVSRKVYPQHPVFAPSSPIIELHREMMGLLGKLSGPWGIQISRAAKRYIQDWITRHVQGRKLIVITIRSSPVASKRNNKLVEWRKFVDSKSQKDFCFVFVMDSDTLFQGYPKELKGQTFFDAACWNIGIRAALYESAYLNLMTHAGPVMLCYFNRKCRFLMFKVCVRREPSASKELIESLGFVEGENLPWATAYQKIIWEDDDHEVIEREFDEMCKSIEKSKVSQASTKEYVEKDSLVKLQ